MTEVSDEEAVIELSKMPGRKLSRMIDIIRAQIPMAVAQKKDDVLARLQHHEWIVVNARMAREDRLAKRRRKAKDGGATWLR